VAVEDQQEIQPLIQHLLVVVVVVVMQLKYLL
jgi:hypothetical protein